MLLKNSGNWGIPSNNAWICSIGWESAGGCELLYLSCVRYLPSLAWRAVNRVERGVNGSVRIYCHHQPNLCWRNEIYSKVTEAETLWVTACWLDVDNEPVVLFTEGQLSNNSSVKRTSTKQDTSSAFALFCMIFPIYLRYNLFALLNSLGDFTLQRMVGGRSKSFIITQLISLLITVILYYNTYYCLYHPRSIWSHVLTTVEDIYTLVF